MAAESLYSQSSDSDEHGCYVSDYNRNGNLYKDWVWKDNEFGDEDGTGDHQSRRLENVLDEEYGEPYPSESDNECGQINSGHP